jgi:hypothetical protein
MKKLTVSLLAGLLALALTACATKEAGATDPTVAAAEAPSEENDGPIGDPFPPPALPPMTDAGSITLFAGGCYYYSSCDTFEVTLRPDGSYTVTGQNGAAGREGNLSAEVFAATEAFLSDSGFGVMPEWMDGSGRSEWTHDNRPYPCMNHAPGVVITRRPGDGSERRVYWDQGCPSARMNAFTTQLREIMRVGEMLSPPPG